MKPKLNRRIWCVWKDCIIETTVAFIGNGSFIIDEYGGSFEEDSWEYNYEDYVEDIDKLFDLIQAGLVEKVGVE